MHDLSFQPKSENELIDLLEVGEGEFHVLKAEKEISKTSRNPMIKLTLKVWDKNGSQSTIFDYLILNDSNFSLRKIRHFCYSCGLESKYELGGLNASDCENKTGKLVIGIQKDKTGQYPDKNTISDYMQLNPQGMVSKPDLNDDIPFFN